MSGLLLLAAAPASSEESVPQGGGCSRTVSPGPVADVQRLVDSLEAGQTGCLRAGTYAGSLKITTAGITLRARPGERVTVSGRLWIAEGADEVTVEGLTLDGRSPRGLPSPTVNADGAVFRSNDVTNRHTGICFSLGHAAYGRADGTLIESNRIHDCGRLPATNHDHGIYVAAASRTMIRNNWIHDNADRGIQLYPDAQRTVITGNVIHGNGQGVIFSGDAGVSSSDNLVQGNTITGSNVRSNVESFYPAGTPAGRNNIVRGNCISGGARDFGNGGIAEPRGFLLSANLIADPRYADPGASDFRLLPNSPCRGVLAQPDAVPGPAGTGAAHASPAGARVVLKVQRRWARRGGRLPLRGRVPGARAREGSRALIVARSAGRRRRLAAADVRRDGRFRARPRLRAARRARTVGIRAVVPGVGRSPEVVVSLAGQRAGPARLR